MSSSTEDGPASARAQRATGSRLGRPRRQGGDPDNRERILDAAEAEFAARGFHGVTVREVTNAAQVDVALAYYYFSSKRGLFDAVFLRRADVLNRERLASLDRYERTAPGGPTVEGLVSAFLEPILDHWANGGPGWRHYFALVAQVNNTPEWGGETMARYFDPVIHRLIDAMRRVMPLAGDQDIYWAYHFLSGALTLTFATTGRIELLSDGACRSDDYEAVRSRMPRYIAAGFRALCDAQATARDGKNT